MRSPGPTSWRPIRPRWRSPGRQGIEGQTRQRIRELVAAEAPRGFVSGILGEEIGL